MNTERRSREGSEMSSSHVFKAWKNSVISPNIQELRLPLQNPPSEPEAIMRDPRVPKNRLKNKNKKNPSVRKVQVFPMAGRGTGLDWFDV